MISDVLTQLEYRLSDAGQLHDRVWCAWHTQAERWDCLKLAQTPEQRYGIRREAHWLKVLRDAAYRGCVDYRGHYQLADCEVLITSRVNGLSLSECLRQSTEFHPEFRNKLYLILQQLHRLGICHGDIKPANIMLADDGPVLIDFASAAALDMPVADLPYRSFSPSYSLPALQRGGGTVDVLHDWYGYLVILSLVNNRTLLKPDWSDSDTVVTTVNSLLADGDGLTATAREDLAQHIQRLPEFT